MDKNECEDKYSESETEEHLNGKRDLFEWIKKQNGVTNAVLEGWIPETKQRPDIMFEYNGKKYVLEYQCSPIATEYVGRHDLYKASGIIDIWIAGYEKYFKKNSRHKFLEDYIEGYYNTFTKNFRIGINTEQGNFVSNMRIVSHFLLKNFVFVNGKIINRTWANDKFNDLHALHNKRICLKNKTEADDQNKLLKRVLSINKYIDSFNGTYDVYHNRLFIYPKNHIDFSKKILDIKKKDFYKHIYDIKQIVIITKKLNKLFDLWSNDVWGFKAIDKEDGIEINVYLFNSDVEHSIRSYTIYQHSKIKIDNETVIKELLAVHMRECIQHGLKGINNIRIMEVRDN